jgi:uncharacterized protein (TIGR00299 family) protein
VTRLLYLDCHAGIAGDMLLGALLDLGLDADALRKGLAALGLPGLDVTVRRVFKRGIACTKVDVGGTGSQTQRGLPEIAALIAASGLPDRVQQRSLAVFRKLAEAEAQVHGSTPEDVHFHEVGAVDAIADIVGAALLLEQLDPQVIVASPVRVGFGTVTGAHGKMPVPAPATALLLCGVTTYAGALPGEWTTPTGAAIVAALADRCERQPEMAVARIGWGAGTRDPEHPNALRALLGHAVDDPAQFHEWRWETVLLLECQVDDMTGQQVAWLIEQLFAAGALDAWTAPVMMKKGRPGHALAALAKDGDDAPVLNVFFRESSTLGVRVQRVPRAVLPREEATRPLRPDGAVRTKVTEFGGMVRFRPEYDDCADHAHKHGLPLATVLHAATHDQPSGSGAVHTPSQSGDK